MSRIVQSGEWTPDTRHLLSYMCHMAQTAQSDAAKRAFTLFAQSETRRIEMQGGTERPSIEKGNGVITQCVDRGGQIDNRQ
jgi:hypothetical protein